MKLAIFYTFFAIVATASNIMAQEAINRVYTGKFDIAVAIAFGTLIGLVVKYMLDKRYIFRFHARDAVHDGQTFLLYTAMGLATTVIFWGFEFGFHYLFETKQMRYIGGMLGLAIGYLTKYYLDKRYVFRVENA
jgi:positive regulator of sigma E activity